MVAWMEERDLPDTLSMILQRLADGETLKAVCASRRWPHGKVFEWIAEDEGRTRLWRAAKVAGAHADVDLARAIALGSEDAGLAVQTLWRGAEANAPEVFGKRMKVERQVSVVADAGLIGFAGEMLKVVAARHALPEKAVIEHSGSDEPSS